MALVSKSNSPPRSQDAADSLFDQATNRCPESLVYGYEYRAPRHGPGAEDVTSLTTWWERSDGPRLVHGLFHVKQEAIRRGDQGPTGQNEESKLRPIPEFALKPLPGLVSASLTISTSGLRG